VTNCIGAASRRQAGIAQCTRCQGLAVSGPGCCLSTSSSPACCCISPRRTRRPLGNRTQPVQATGCRAQGGGDSEAVLGTAPQSTVSGGTGRDEKPRGDLDAGAQFQAPVNSPLPAVPKRAAQREVRCAHSAGQGSITDLARSVRRWPLGQWSDRTRRLARCPYSPHTRPGTPRRSRVARSRIPR
jgi:hypothetical protein